LFTLLAVGEYSGLLPHYTNVLFPHGHGSEAGSAHSHGEGSTASGEPHRDDLPSDAGEEPRRTPPPDPTGAGGDDPTVHFNEGTGTAHVHGGGGDEAPSGGDFPAPAHLAAAQSSGSGTNGSFAGPSAITGPAAGGGGADSHASHDLLFVAGRIFPFVVVLLLTSYFTTVVADRLRRSEKDLENAARTAMLEHERLESVIHTARVGMMLVEPEVTIRWFSHRAAGWLNLTPGNIGRHCPLDGASGGCPECLVRKTALTGESLEAERAVTGEGGALRHFRHGTSPIRDEKGRVVQVVELVEEITSRKVLESEALHAGKLSVLGRMAAGIAHEIGNPLSSLTTRLHLMEQRGGPDFVQESLKVLHGQIGRIGRIVRGVSQFAKPEAEGWSVWDVNQVLDEAVGIVRLDRRAREIEFERSLASPSPKVRGVKDQVSQVLLNLLLNAVEAMPEGGSVRTETFQRNGMACVAISDSGPGMDEAVRARLFEPFFTTKPEGTGLGLSVSYSLVHAHGGRIEVESRPGEGSRFAVLLPVAFAEPHGKT
jgi:signal transduction histidine kinase